MSEKKKETLKQLEKLLTDDTKDNSDYKAGISLSKRELTGIIIRLSVSLILILVVFFAGVFERPIFIPLAIAAVVLMEINLYRKSKDQKSGKKN
ncbi:MAG: hypothetical protein KAW12_21535 [Candidatus Aminicenantes bacterium]|nr:hypothetical protein [Candidatus Aminicenantes bacterium]